MTRAVAVHGLARRVGMLGRYGRIRTAISGSHTRAPRALTRLEPAADAG